MEPLDILYITLAVCVIFVSIPLMMVLWRMYQMLDPIHGILRNLNRVSRFLVGIETLPWRIMHRFFK